MKRVIHLTIAAIQLALLSMHATVAIAEASHDGSEETSVPSDSIFQLSSTWADQSGNTLSLRSLRGRPSVISMIYTSCDYSCPITLALLKNIYSAVKAKTGTPPRFVLVSLDPERDTVSKIERYAETAALDLHDWTVLRGSAPDTRELAIVLGVKYKKAENGVIAHSNVIAVLDPAGRIIHKQTTLNSGTAETVDAILSVSKPASAS